MSTSLLIPKICIYCGKRFAAKTTVTRYCSHLCNQRHYKAVKREEKVQQSLASNAEEMEEKLTVSAKANGSDTNEFLSIQEAANLLGVSRWTIQRLIKNNRIKAAKLGSRTIIPRTTITRLFS